MVTHLIATANMARVIQTIAFGWNNVNTLIRAGTKCAQSIKDASVREANLARLNAFANAARKAKDDQLDPAVFMESLNVKGLDSAVKNALFHTGV